MKSFKALQRRRDGKKFEMRVKVEHRTSFEELLRVVKNSQQWVGDHGCGTCVVAIKTSADGHERHALAPSSVHDEKRAVTCKNSWQQQPLMMCDASNFLYFCVVSVQLEKVLVPATDSDGLTEISAPAEHYTTHRMSTATLLMPTKDEMLWDVERQRDELVLRLQSVDKVAHQGRLEVVHEQFRKKFEDLKTNWLCIARQFVVDLKYELQGVKCDLHMEKMEKQAVESAKSTLDLENERLLAELRQERTRNDALQKTAKLKLELDSENRRLQAELQQERSLKEVYATFVVEFVAGLNVNSEEKQPAEAKSVVEDSAVVMRVLQHSHVPPSAQSPDSPTPVLEVGNPSFCLSVGLKRANLAPVVAGAARGTAATLPRP
jgi:hypothetical protein